MALFSHRTIFAGNVFNASAYASNRRKFVLREKVNEILETLAIISIFARVFG